jgi:hypothetical protein
MRLYGCETLSLTLTTEERLGVVENMTFREKIWSYVAGRGTGAHKIELHKMYQLANTTTEIKSRR